MNIYIKPQICSENKITRRDRTTTTKNIFVNKIRTKKIRITNK